MSNDTLDEVAKKIGISKSTTFLAVRKIRNYLKESIDNPFKEN
jgi:predicted DNA binding protein